MKLPPPLLVALSACLFSSAGHADDEHTTVPVFLPYYEPKSWSLVRGSILTSNAEETTYTIFCAPDCDLAMDFPFIFAEGDNTLRFEGTHTSTYTANLECELGGTTAATCSAYSSLKSGYTIGQYTGPTEVSWTSTLSGSEVEWGVLTLADKPSKTDSLDDIEATALPSDESFVSGDLLFDGTLPTSTDVQPEETNSSAALATRSHWMLAGPVLAMLGAALI